VVARAILPTNRGMLYKAATGKVAPHLTYWLTHKCEPNYTDATIAIPVSES